MDTLTPVHLEPDNQIWGRAIYHYFGFYFLLRVYYKMTKVHVNLLSS